MPPVFTACRTYPCDELCLSVDLDQPALHHLSEPRCQTPAYFLHSAHTREVSAALGGVGRVADVKPKFEARHTRKVYFSFCASGTKKAHMSEFRSSGQICEKTEG